MDPINVETITPQTHALVVVVRKEAPTDDGAVVGEVIVQSTYDPTTTARLLRDIADECERRG